MVKKYESLEILRNDEEIEKLEVGDIVFDNNQNGLDYIGIVKKHDGIKKIEDNETIKSIKKALVFSDVVLVFREVK